MPIEKEKENFIPVVILAIVIICLAIIPMRIVGYGFLPSDDALRHSAKAVSGKAWDEILVLRDEIKFDNHPGWHSILGFIHRVTGCNQDSLVVFSVMGLSLIFFFIPLLFIYRQEAWLLTLLIFLLASPSFVFRLFFGRPYIITMSVVLLIIFLWPKLKEEKLHYPVFILTTLLIAIATWIHGSWYLLALPIASFLLAREWRVAFRLSLSIACGIILGAILTSHPYIFLKQNLMHLVLALGDKPLQRMLVGEFQPSTGDLFIIAAVIFLLIWKRMSGRWNKNIIDNPVFILVVLGWISGFAVKRFWFDWGMVALAGWMVLQLQEILDEKLDFFSSRRLFITIASALALYLAVTADVNGRWTQNLTKEYLSADDPKQVEWLPAPGGIIYSDDMTVFYDTFFRNPHAPWRYILGFEPALMPKEDLAIYRKIQWNYRAYQAYEPWAKKMRPSDRLILRRPWNEKPNIPELEWYYAATDIWIGRPR